MDPISEERRRTLEIDLRFEVCPYTIEKFIDRPKEFEAPSNLDKIAAYRCCINGQPSPENISTLFGYSIAFLPCSMEFAVHDCPLYAAYRDKNK